MRLVLASQNEHKARELDAVLLSWEIALLGLELPEETGSSFLENARGKARFARGHADREAWVAGEDSGLEVDGLGGRPGIRSARFAGEGATDEENVRRLLTELEGVAGAGRRARYVCELVCLDPHGEEVRARGTLEGAIAPAPRGGGGFGYDPVFLPEGEMRTVAELGDEWKGEHSHRARAAREVARVLGERAQAL